MSLNVDDVAYPRTMTKIALGTARLTRQVSSTLDLAGRHE
jgi:hypothetical protein